LKNNVKNELLLH